jgi:hypothetical protein
MNRSPRHVTIDTEYGNLSYLEQLARLPDGSSQIVRWSGWLNGEPIDRERLATLVAVAGIEATMERCDHTYQVPLLAGIADGQPCTKCGEPYHRQRRSA